MKPSIGRIVHFVLASGPRAGEHRAAIITNVFGGDVVNLSVLLDQHDDWSFPAPALIDGAGAAVGGVTLAQAPQWIGRAWSVYHSEVPAHGTWHWPERETCAAEPPSSAPSASV